MNSIAGWFGAIGIAAVLALYPQNTRAEGFTGKEFLAWSKSAQDSFIQTSVTMASIMATKVKKASGDCIADWYLAADADRNALNTDIRETISRNDTYHPSAIIFVLLEQKCGPF